VISPTRKLAHTHVKDAFSMFLSEGPQGTTRKPHERVKVECLSSPENSSPRDVLSCSGRVE
jgi:hypothetical protein